MKKPAPKKMSASLREAEWKLSSAIVRGAPDDQIRRFTSERDAIVVEQSKLKLSRIGYGKLNRILR